MLRPHYQDFDRVRNGYVTKSQFLRVLNSFDIYPTEEYLNILLKRYVDKGTLDEVNYYKFCNDVDGQDKVTKDISQNYANKFMIPCNKVIDTPYISHHIPKNVEEIIQKIRKMVKEDRIRIWGFLQEQVLQGV